MVLLIVFAVVWVACDLQPGFHSRLHNGTDLVASLGEQMSEALLPQLLHGV